MSDHLPVTHKSPWYHLPPSARIPVSPSSPPPLPRPRCIPTSKCVHVYYTDTGDRRRRRHTLARGLLTHTRWYAVADRCATGGVTASRRRCMSDIASMYYLRPRARLSWTVKQHRGLPDAPLTSAVRRLPRRRGPPAAEASLLSAHDVLLDAGPRVSAAWLLIA